MQSPPQDGGYKPNAVLESDLAFLEQMEQVGKRTCCTRAFCSCVVGRSGVVLATGFAGVLPGEPTCKDAGHQLVRHFRSDGTSSEHCERCVHAEQMAVANAAFAGTSLRQSTAYVSFTPCKTCASVLALAGVVRVVALRYSKAPAEGMRILTGQGIEVIHVMPEPQHYGE
ncbi:MAG: deoxycytidylate deaminase [Armatimonadota bacterium]